MQNSVVYAPMPAALPLPPAGFLFQEVPGRVGPCVLVSTRLEVGKAGVLLEALGRQWATPLLRARHLAHLAGERAARAGKKAFSSASPLPKPCCSKFTELIAGHAIHRSDARRSALAAPAPFFSSSAPPQSL